MEQALQSRRSQTLQELVEQMCLSPVQEWLQGLGMGNKPAA